MGIGKPALVLVVVIAMLAVGGDGLDKRSAHVGSWPELIADDPAARQVCLLDRLHPNLHFMDLLVGGPLAAEAAAEIAAQVRQTPDPNVPKVYQERGKTVREYNLEIKEKVFDYGGGNTWTAWTYNGSVPGPTLRVKAGEILRVRVTNHLNRVHTFHSHMQYYPIESDGSQVNIINNKGTGAMIPPGGTYTYEFRPEQPDVTYYHCHAADKDFAINQHILQGLYGFVVVEDPKAPPMREDVLVMAEIGSLTKGNNVPPYIMNALGVPGGELTLERIYKAQGLQGIVRQLGKTVPYFKLKVGEPMKLHVVNLGNLYHSLHIHEIPLISLGVLNGRPWPAEVLPLVSGAEDTLLIKFRYPGIWLFHCHVVNHADAGMVGVFIVEQ